jgi:arylsulfatase A-like enzyme
MDDAIKAQKPFYLHMAHYAVHTPFQSDDRFADNYRNSGKSPPAQAFATLIEGMDKSLGDLMDHLKERGIADNTLIFFLGDNGSDAPLGNPDAIASSSPLRGKKGSKWEGGIRVPFMAAWAAKARANAWQKKLPIAAGAMRFETGACFDIFPTILSLLEQPMPAGHAIDGQDLSPLLSGVGNSNHRNVVLSHFPHPRHHKHFTSYRSEDWKIIYSYNPEQQTKPSYELYNLREDLSETNNLAESHPEQLKSLALAMSRELEAMQALYPTQDGTSIKPIIPE